jgi:predicted ATPase
VQGDFGNALRHLQNAIQIYDPQRDRETKFIFDAGVFATQYLAMARWPLGEVEEARGLLGDARRRAIESAQPPFLAMQYAIEAMFETLRGDAKAVQRAAELCIDVSRAHGVAVFLSHGIGSLGWARVELGDRRAGIAQLNECISTHIEQGNRVYFPVFQGLLAEIEGREGGLKAGLNRIDEAIALTSEMGTRWCEAFLLHIRGKILLNFNPASTEAAESAFLAAIDVAQQQKAKSFELQAAHALAKLYQSAGRAADAHAVLAPALEGFSPTPEFPEIAEAQTLLAALAESDDVKTATAARQRRLKLQTGYGQALMWSKGYAAPETTAAFARAQELNAGGEGANERFVTYYGQSAARLWSGDLGAAQEIAANMLRDAGPASQTPEALAAYRFVGVGLLCQGKFTEAKTYFENALKIDDSGWDRDAKLRFGQDSRVSAMVYLADANWRLGDVRAAHELMEQGLAAALETGHVPTLAHTHFMTGLFHCFRADADSVRRHANAVVELSREHQLSQYQAVGHMLHGWARARLGDREEGLAETRNALAAFSARGTRLLTPLCQGLIAELEAEGPNTEEALTRADTALQIARETGEHWTDSFLHRIRGEILLKREPANSPPAEDAFLTAIAVAQQQKARSFELRAALSLTKLYQSTGRTADAHAVLAPALEGFSPTPELSEIEQAQTLLAVLKHTSASS